MAKIPIIIPPQNYFLLPPLPPLFIHYLLREHARIHQIGSSPPPPRSSQGQFHGSGTRQKYPYRPLLARSSIHLHDLHSRSPYSFFFRSSSFSFNQLHERSIGRATKRARRSRASKRADRRVGRYSIAPQGSSTAGATRSLARSASACPSSQRPKLNSPLYLLVKKKRNLQSRRLFFYARCLFHYPPIMPAFVIG